MPLFMVWITSGCSEDDINVSETGKGTYFAIECVLSSTGTAWA